MTTYYCDLANDFTDATGDPDGDGSGDIYDGPGGFQAAIEGWGNATALAAGDTLYLKGTADLSKFVKLTVDVDKTGTWVISDVVQNHNDGGGSSGDDWVGELVYIDATTVWVQINAASTEYNDVDTADGIDNTTQTETIAGANMTGKACPGILVDNNSGDETSGWIHLVGADGSWVARGAQFVLDGKGSAAAARAARCLHADAAGYVIEYGTFQNSAGDGVNPNTTTTYGQAWVFRHCLFSNNTSVGVVSTYRVNMYFIRCIAESNSGIGFQGGVRHVFGRSSNNGGIGFKDPAILAGCVASGNTGDGVTGNAFCFQCVFDDNADGIHTETWHSGPWVIGCRITNNSGYGWQDGNTICETVIEDWNVFHGNDGGGTGKDLLNVLTGRHSYGDSSGGGSESHISDPSDDGYVDAANDDYNIAIGKEHRSTAIDLDWDS